MGLFDRFRSRKPAPPPATTTASAAPVSKGPCSDPAPGDDEWCPGDLAECIYAGPWFMGGQFATDDGPRYSEIRMVSHVEFSRYLLIDGRHSVMLSFDRWAPARFQASGFRKVIPRADEARRADARFCEHLVRQPALISLGSPEDV